MKRVYQICVVGIILAFTCLGSPAEDKSDNEKLVFDFCYALQASMVCKNLKMRIDTERKIERKVGAKIRGPVSPYNDACSAGLEAEFADENFEDGNKRLCKKAWALYGCNGTKVPKLLFQIDGDYCVYE
jgi:hypothetical protein